MAQAIHEEDRAARDADEADRRAPCGPLDLRQLAIEWAHWREGLIRRYNLAGLVREESEAERTNCESWWTGRAT